MKRTFVGASIIYGYDIQITSPGVPHPTMSSPIVVSVYIAALLFNRYKNKLGHVHCIFRHDHVVDTQNSSL